jgi:hypothetical protein
MQPIKYISQFLLCTCIGCHNSHETKTTETPDSTLVIKADTISLERNTVQKNPVAAYTEKVPDELNKWVFSVNVYETKRRFHYIVRIQYKELRITDSIHVPNFGIEPTIQIQKDNTPFSCTLGFTDKKGSFKPLSRASVKEERLRFKKVASYAVGVYRTSM